MNGPYIKIGAGCRNNFGKRQRLLEVNQAVLGTTESETEGLGSNFSVPVMCCGLYKVTSPTTGLRMQRPEIRLFLREIRAKLLPICPDRDALMYISCLGRELLDKRRLLAYPQSCGLGLGCGSWLLDRGRLVSRSLNFSAREENAVAYCRVPR